MKNLFRCLLVSSVCCSLEAMNLAFWTIPNNHGPKENSNALKMTYLSPTIHNQLSLLEMLKREAPSMREDVRNKVITTLTCANHFNTPYSPFLTVIDYSRPSNQKRLWIFDLNRQRLLYFTYVSHGLKSGEKDTTYFSNIFNSRASSLGVYLTSQAYLGREGTSLRLKGLDRGLNDNAENRSIVMHGGFYVEENFIKKYGRAGRSWGCPALPASKTTNIINTIKNNNLMVLYYPSDNWFSKSRFLNCQNYTLIPTKDTDVKNVEIPKQLNEIREDVLFASLSAKQFGTETPPILAMPADYYRERFATVPPLKRMLRRQMNKQEYIALSKEEYKLLAQENSEKDLNHLCFIIPTLTTHHGYVQTVMKAVNLGLIKKLHHESNYWIETSKQSHLGLQTNNKFIRWLGL